MRQMLLLVFVGVLGGLFGSIATCTLFVSTGVTDWDRIREDVGLSVERATPYLEQGWQWLASAYDTGKGYLAAAILLSAMLAGYCFARDARKKIRA